MNKKLLLSFILFFTFLTNYGQCASYPSFTTSQTTAGNQTFCIDGTNPLTVAIAAQQYAVLNVIKGYTYTFSVSNIWGTSGGGSNIEYLGIYNNATNAKLIESNNSNGVTINNWVSTLSGQVKILLLRGNSCTTTTNTTNGTLTMTLVTVANSSTIDSQTAFGTGSWKGHIYNFTGDTPPGGFPSPTILSETTYPFITNLPANYAGYYDVGSDLFPTGFNFGGNNDTTCFDVYSEGSVRASMLTNNFAVRYRMRFNKTPGCYFVKITGDDGVRLYIDNKLVFDRWVQQPPTNYDYILVNLTTNSNLVLDYYENSSNNEVNFQILPFDPNANTIIAPATVNFCTGEDPAIIEGSFKYNDSGTEMDNPYINYQWKVSTNGAAYVNVPSNGNKRTYDPPAIINATGTNIVTKYMRIATVNTTTAIGVTCNFNESNEVTFITSSSAPASPGVITGVATQCASISGQIYSIVPILNAVSYNWSVPTGWNITSGAGTSTITVSTGTSGQNGNITVRSVNGCGSSAVRSLPVTVNASIGGTVSGNSTVCAGTNNTVFSLSSNSGNVIRWESSTDNFASVITPISNTTTTLTATDVTATTNYRAIVQNGSCATANSSIGTVLIKNPVATGVVICQGSPAGSLTATASCAAVAQTPLTASGTGGTSNTTSYTGSGNKGITINFPALPAGAVVTSTNVKISFQSIGTSWISELFIRVTPPTAMGPIQNDINPFPNNSANNRADSVFGIPIGTWGTGNPTGNWIFDFREYVDDGGNPDARITDITITVNYTLPGTLDWFTTASGGTKIGSGSSFNPIGILNSGLADTNTSGTTPYYVACSSDPACRTMVNYVINPAPAPVIGTILQPNCKISTGSIELSGLPLSGTLTRLPGSINIPYSGTAVTDSNLGVGTYSYTVGNGTCTSVATAGIPINAPPVVATYNAGSWSSPPTIEKMLVFAGNFISTGDVVGCACEVNSGVNVLIKEGHTLTIANEVKVLGGTLSFKNNSSLMQTNNDPTINSGDISYERISTPIYQKDYIYWSSPVKNQKLGDLSPGTDPQKFFFNDGTNWVFIDRSNSMDIGKGYIIRGPLSYNNSTKQTFPAIFKGVPNNGSLEGELLSKGKYHFIGNPYPSALNADALISQNSTLLNGTIYFWTHNTPINSSLSQDYQYTSDDYATYNLSGGVSAKSDINHNNPVGVDNGIKPTGKIAAGQSFFVSTRTAGKVQFNNTMRVGGANNGQFFKSGDTEKEVVLEKNRIWLNMTNDKGAFKQLLVGYIEGATNFYENRYDGITFDGNTFLDFYSVNNGNKFVIQGRALPFDDSDLVPLGYRSAIEGAFTISIDEVDGKMKNQAIYIEDKVTGKIHDLRSSNYTFKTAIGTFTDRFVLRYTDKTLGTGDFENTEDGILISVKNKTINVLSSKENIKDVTIFDITGKTLYSKNKVSNTELQIQNLSSGNQVLLVKVILDNDFATTRKIIFQ
jgi:hypothetical protein